MKFSDYLNEKEISSIIEFRADSSRVIDPAKGKEGKPIAFFSTRKNVAGWSIYALSDFDRQWLKDKGVDTSNVYRIYSDHGTTTLVKINLKRALVYFFDNEHFMDTDETRFQRRGEKAKVFIIEEGMGKHFGL